MNFFKIRVGGEGGWVCHTTNNELAAALKIIANFIPFERSRRSNGPLSCSNLQVEPMRWMAVEANH